MQIRWIIVNTLVAVAVTVAVTVLISGRQWNNYATAEYLRGHSIGLEKGFDNGYEAAENDAEGEYYRGSYDTCMLGAKNPITCNGGVLMMYKNDWYEKPSPGFLWPIVDKSKLKSG